MVRRLGLGKNNHLTYTSLALNPRYRVFLHSLSFVFSLKLACDFGFQCTSYSIKHVLAKAFFAGHTLSSEQFASILIRHRHIIIIMYPICKCTTALGNMFCAFPLSYYRINIQIIVGHYKTVKTTVNYCYLDFAYLE